MKYEVVPTLGVPDQSEWRVEAIDYESEGECYVTIFSGPQSKERAEEYARFKSKDQPFIRRIFNEAKAIIEKEGRE